MSAKLLFLFFKGESCRMKHGNAADELQNLPDERRFPSFRAVRPLAALCLRHAKRNGKMVNLGKSQKRR